MAKPRIDPNEPRWLLLIHQIPPKPAYFRAKVGRRLQRIGAVAIKNSVYALPLTDQTQEDFQWVAREISEEGGEATLCSASLIEGLRDAQVEALFHAAREADYAQIADEARTIVSGTPSKISSTDERRPELESDHLRLKKRMDEVSAIDFFGAPGREPAHAALALLEKRLRSTERPASTPPPERPQRDAYQGRTWVTRKNIHVDRIASAWLIRSFIDDKPTFKFVPGTKYRSKPDEVTFDMFEADFTHVGDRCTFEVLLERFDIHNPGLAPIAEIIHDIDVKDGKFARVEAPGMASLIAGIALTCGEDARRLELGARIFDALFALYRRKKS
jgi:hypothetical protein